MVMSSEGLKFCSSRCVIVFHEYSNKLSKVFKEHQADINFVLVGAFYGNDDSSIEKMFLSNIHWRAAIVDAVDSNIRNLKHYLFKTHIVSGSSRISLKLQQLSCVRPQVNRLR